jgi:hypothetical protein
VTLDTTAPAAPVISSFGPDTGTVRDGTSATTLTLMGTAEANSTVMVFDGAIQLGSAVSNRLGAWTYTAASLSSGTNSFTATAIDAAGDASTRSTALTVTITPSSPTTTLESYGLTALVQSGTNFFMKPVAGGSGPELQYSGVPVTSGEFGPWTPLGAEATSNGYEIAWKYGTTDQYTVWNTDSSGNYLSNTAFVSGSSSTLESLEPSFHQDLNGDGVIGLPSTAPTTTTITIESYGSTALVQSGSNFLMKPVAGGSGPELQYSGAADGVIGLSTIATGATPLQHQTLF